MRHARHDAALNAAENAVTVETRPREQKYIIIVFDGPASPDRAASYSSNIDQVDCAVVCEAVANTIRSSNH